MGRLQRVKGLAVVFVYLSAEEAISRLKPTTCPPISTHKAAVETFDTK